MCVFNQRPCVGGWGWGNGVALLKCGLLYCINVPTSRCMNTTWCVCVVYGGGDCEIVCPCVTDDCGICVCAGMWMCDCIILGEVIMCVVIMPVMECLCV